MLSFSHYYKTTRERIMKINVKLKYLSCKYLHNIECMVSITKKQSTKICLYDICLNISMPNHITWYVGEISVVKSFFKNIFHVSISIAKKSKVGLTANITNLMSLSGNWVSLSDAVTVATVTPNFVLSGIHSFTFPDKISGGKLFPVINNQIMCMKVEYF